MDALGDSPPLETVKQCSDVGIFSVRVKIFSGDTEVSTDEYPCFSLGVDGPTLEPGEYTIEVQGLRRSGEPWFDPDVDPEVDPEVDPDADPIAYGSTTVIVSEGALPSAEVVLLAPLECDDGIDNDRDGVVDGQDPGCDVVTLIGAPSESNDADVTLFDLGVTFLDSPAVRPTNVSVQSVLFEVDGELLAQISESQLDYTQWAFQLPLLAGEFAAGDHQLTATAIGKDGALTAAQMIPFTTIDNQGTYVAGTFDFGSETFLQPIVEPLRFGFSPDCTPGGTLVLETMRVRIVDENDEAVPLDSLVGNTVGGSIPETLGGPDMQGWYTFGCPTSSIASDPLPWGHYRIEAQARLAGISCFETPSETGAVELAPQPVDAQSITLERVIVDGQPACPECSKDQDCTMLAGTICDEGLCVEKAMTP